MLPIEALASRQLDAYNAADLDAFCACYHPDVQVLDAEGVEQSRGLTAFRARYEAMFAAGSFGARVDARLAVGEHCVDRERYWRIDPVSGERIEGEVLVRYRLRDDAIGAVQFFR